MTAERPWIVFALLLVCTSPALAQDGRLSLSLSGGGVLSKQSEGTGVVLKPTNSLGIVASLRFRIAKKSSLEFSYGRVKNSQKFTTPSLDFRAFTTVAEFSGAYVYRPLQRGKFEPFVFGGAGLMVFNPDDTTVGGVETNFGAVRQYRPGFLYGGGTDYKLFWRLAARVQYRGLVYSAPDFKVQTLFTGSKGHMAEGLVGLVFNF